MGATTSRGLDALSLRVIIKLKTASAIVWGSSKTIFDFSEKKQPEDIMVKVFVEHWERVPKRRFIVGKWRRTKKAVFAISLNFKRKCANKLTPICYAWYLAAMSFRIQLLRFSLICLTCLQVLLSKAWNHWHYIEQ